MPIAVVTGASRGLGLELTRELAERGWDLIVDARDEERLWESIHSLPGKDRITAIAGDVADPMHRERLARSAAAAGGLDLLVNNASTLGPTPRPGLDTFPVDELERVFKVNVIAPVALTQLLLPHLRAARGMVVNVTSDAATEPYEGWGGYGSSKAALEQVTAILGAEQPSVLVYAFDPGDMRTRMQQDAFPDEDISDRPEPRSVVPSLLRLIEERPPGGRYRHEEVAMIAGSGVQ